MSNTNRRLVLRHRPEGVVTDDCFALDTAPVTDPAPGQILVRNLWLAFEPAQRGWLNDIPSYVPPVQLGEVMRSWGLGQIEASAHPDLPAGALVHGTVGWQEYALIDVAGSDVEVVPANLGDPRLILSVAGITGLTAYFGMTEIARPGDGDTVLVTAAAGATGSVAAQIARILGAATVVGTAGSDAKRSWVTDVAGLDACVNHHDPKVRRELGEHALDGYDAVFDNVGGALLDAAIFNVAVHGRIALCGSISTGYAPKRPEVGLHYYQLLTTRRARMEGFLVTDYGDRFDHARRQLLDWAGSGALHVEHDEIAGLERAPEGLRRLFEGRNTGKQLLHLADPR